MSSRWDLPVLPTVAGASTGRRVQYAALPYRVRGDGEVQIRLITSRETRRWVIPKGWPIKGLTPPKTAAREAYEEAGLVGVISREPLGLYTYEKRLGTRSVLCDVLVFPLKVKRSLQKWPERFQRFGFWFSIDSAAAAVQEEDLCELIRAFGALMARRWAAKLEAKAAVRGKGEPAPAESDAAAGTGASTKTRGKGKGGKGAPAKAAAQRAEDARASAAWTVDPAVTAVDQAPGPKKAGAKPAKGKAAKVKAPKENGAKRNGTNGNGAAQGAAADAVASSGARADGVPSGPRDAAVPVQPVTPPPAEPAPAGAKALKPKPKPKPKPKAKPSKVGAGKSPTAKSADGKAGAPKSGAGKSGAPEPGAASAAIGQSATSALAADAREAVAAAMGEGSSPSVSREPAAPPAVKAKAAKAKPAKAKPASKPVNKPGKSGPGKTGPGKS